MSKIKRYLVGPGVRGCARSGTLVHRDPVAASRVYQSTDKIRATYVKHELSRPTAVSSSSSSVSFNLLSLPPLLFISNLVNLPLAYPLLLLVWLLPSSYLFSPSDLIQILLSPRRMSLDLPRRTS